MYRTDITVTHEVRRPPQAGREVPSTAVTFRPDAVRGAPTGGFAGVVDFRLARNAVIKEFKRGRLSRLDVCDAHPELLRNAEHCGRPSTEACPICDGTDGELVLVTYVFGSRLPASGRCMTSVQELQKLDKGSRELAAYVVEVCRGCSWNHLLRTFPVGRRS